MGILYDQKAIKIPQWTQHYRLLVALWSTLDNGWKYSKKVKLAGNGNQGKTREVSEEDIDWDLYILQLKKVNKFWCNICKSGLSCRGYFKLEML